jgi:hypothetical protein
MNHDSKTCKECIRLQKMMFKNGATVIYAGTQESELIVKQPAGVGAGANMGGMQQ